MDLIAGWLPRMVQHCAFNKEEKQIFTIIRATLLSCSFNFLKRKPTLDKILVSRYDTPLDSLFLKTL
jgi:hypothetical protein